MKLQVPFQIKASSGREISGHGSVFDNVDLGGDIVLEGAFTTSLAKHSRDGTNPAMLWQHQHDQPIGVWTHISEDDKGLALVGEIADTTLGRDVQKLASMRAVSGLSIGFELLDFDFDKHGIRYIKEVALWEISVVTFPMNTRATIEAIKTLTPRELEKCLRQQVGVSNRDAKKIISNIVRDGKSLDEQRDAEDEDEDEMAKLISGFHEQLIADRLRRLRINHG